jgi:hypothetical protein
LLRARMIITTNEQHVRLLSSEAFDCFALQSLVGPGSRHCLWNHFTQNPGSPLLAASSVGNAVPH